MPPCSHFWLSLRGCWVRQVWRVITSNLLPEWLERSRKDLPCIYCRTCELTATEQERERERVEICAIMINTDQLCIHTCRLICLNNAMVPASFLFLICHVERTMKPWKKGPVAAVACWTPIILRRTMTAGEQLAEQLVEAISPYEDLSHLSDSTGRARFWRQKSGIQRFNRIQPTQSGIEIGFDIFDQKLGFFQHKATKQDFIRKRSEWRGVQTWRYARLETTLVWWKSTGLAGISFAGWSCCIQVSNSIPSGELT